MRIPRSQYLATAVATVLGLSLAFGVATSAESAQVKREFDGATRVFYSDSLPALTLPIPESYDYIGRLEFDLFGVAHVDRHMFAAVRHDTIQRLIVFQFEGFLDSVEDEYSFQVPTKADEIAGSNYRFSPELVEWAGEQYVHNTWAFDHQAAAQERPDAEAGRLLELLKAKGLKLAAGLIMSRYVTAIGDNNRHELILFYMEPLSAHGHTLADFPDGGTANKSYDKLHQLITERSQKIFGKLRP